MKPGRWKLASVSKSTTTTDDNDGFFETLTPSTWWVLIEPMDPSVSDGTRTQQRRVTGRYRSDITIDTRLVVGSRELFVKGVQNPGEMDRDLVLLCDEITA